MAQMTFTFTITTRLFVRVSIRSTTSIGTTTPIVFTATTLTRLPDPTKSFCPYLSGSSTIQKVSHFTTVKVVMAIDWIAYFHWREAVEITSTSWIGVTNSVADWSCY